MVSMIGSNVPAWNYGWLIASCHLAEHTALRCVPNATECDYSHFGGELVKMYGQPIKKNLTRFLGLSLMLKSSLLFAQFWMPPQFNNSMKQTKKAAADKITLAATAPKKASNIIYVLTCAQYGNVELDVWCRIYNTLEAAKAALLARYKLYSEDWDEEAAEEQMDSLCLSKDGMSFSTVAAGNYTAETWIITKADLDKIDD